MTGKDMGGRDVEEDHDLLTYNEAGARLHEEISALEAYLAGPVADAAGRERAQKRLLLLRECAERNRSASERDFGARSFLQYHPSRSTGSTG
jgi:hypothetical protein